MKNQDQLDFARRHPIFYIPTTLLGLMLLGYSLTATAQTLNLATWIKVCLFIGGVLLNLVGLVLSAGMLYLIVKSLATPNSRSTKDEE